MADSIHELPPFPGIRTKGLDFLEALRIEKHQDRSWFNARKHLYTDELRWPMRCLVADILRRSQGHQTVALYGDPARSVFRIYRDVRFSKNKRPYQKHVACKFTLDPGMSDADGLVYVHIEPPNDSFVAAGIYGPPVKRLRPIRTRIVRDATAWGEVLRQLDGAGLVPESHGDDLKGMPRGFAAYSDHEMADFLRWTSFLVSRKIDSDSIKSPQLADEVMAFTRSAWPLLSFISETK